MKLIPSLIAFCLAASGIGLHAEEMSKRDFYEILGVNRDGFRKRVGVRHQNAFEIGMSPLDGGGTPDFKKPRLSWSRRPWADPRR